jgi:type I restriction enzyme M protein
MNLALRGIDGQIAHGDTFHNDRFPDLTDDFILANPPFHVSDWRGDLLREDKRWKYGVPPADNANFAWVQHMIHHLAPSGVAGFVLANGSMSSGQSGEGEIRKAIIEADLVDCMVARLASSSTRRRFPPASGSSPGTVRTASSATAAARSSSSTPASSAA